MELPTVFQETENKKEHVYDLKQPLSNTSAQPTTGCVYSLSVYYYLFLDFIWLWYCFLSDRELSSDGGWGRRTTI